MGSWCAGWGDRGSESVLGKSLTRCWRWEFALKVREAAPEPQRVLNPNCDPTGNASGGLHSLGTGSDFGMSVCPLPGQCHFMSSSKAERYWILQQTLKPYFTIDFLLENALVSLRFPR